MIKIQNKKILEYLKQKDLLVNQGRGISSEIEGIELAISELDKTEKEYTTACEPKELMEEGKVLQEEINKLILKLQDVSEKIKDKKINAIPKEMVDKHYKLRDTKEKLERERNKIALKIQKIKDKVIPMIKKSVMPHLEEYDDIEKAEIIDDEVVVTTFNRLEEFKKQFKKG